MLFRAWFSGLSALGYPCNLTMLPRPPRGPGLAGLRPTLETLLLIEVSALRPYSPRNSKTLISPKFRGSRNGHCPIPSQYRL
jgi:hypothetical protein